MNEFEYQSVSALTLPDFKLPMVDVNSREQMMAARQAFEDAVDQYYIDHPEENMGTFVYAPIFADINMGQLFRYTAAERALVSYSNTSLVIAMPDLFEIRHIGAGGNGVVRTHLKSATAMQKALLEWKIPQHGVADDEPRLSKKQVVDFLRQFDYLRQEIVRGSYVDPMVLLAQLLNALSSHEDKDLVDLLNEKLKQV